MGRRPWKETDEKYSQRVVVLVTQAFKDAYRDYCQDNGQDMGSRVRELMEADFESSQL